MRTGRLSGCSDSKKVKKRQPFFSRSCQNSAQRSSNVSGSARGRAERLLQLGDIAFTAGISLIGDPESPEGAVCCLSIPKIPVREQESSKVPYVELNAIFESSSDGIWVCDGTGKVIRINDASEKLNGIRAENTVGRHVSEIMADRAF